MDEKKKNCKRIGPLLGRYLDGELDSQQEAAVSAELASCEVCRAEYNRLQKLGALVREVYIEQLRNVNLDALLPGVEARIAQEPQTWRARIAAFFERYWLGLASPVAPIGVAATLVVVITAATLIYASRSTSPTDVSFAPGSSVAQIEAGDHGDSRGEIGDSGAYLVEGSNGSVVAGAENRRPMHEEKPYRKNEAYITSYAADSGIVVIDVDLEGDSPAVVWHLQDGPESPAEEDNRI